MRLLGNLFNPGEEKKKAKHEIVWALLIPLPNVVTSPNSDFPRGGKLFIIATVAMAACFHVIVLLFSSDITPLIHVPDLQSQASQTEGNIQELLKNHRRKPTLPCSLSPSVFKHCIVRWRKWSLSLYRQSKTLKNFNNPAISQPPPPTPLAAELKLSHKSNGWGVGGGEELKSSYLRACPWLYFHQHKDTKNPGNSPILIKIFAV